MKVVSAAEMQAMDQKTIGSFGLPGRVLMENAGRGATRSFLKRIYQNDNGRVGILCGRGNNGGDGFVIARYLSQAGLDITVYLLGTHDRVKGDAADNLKMMPALNIPVIEIPGANSFLNQQSDMAQIRYWIDALLGTGLNSDVRGLFRQAIEFVNHQKRPILAVDIPSGLNSDSGRPMGISIKADATATFGFPKIGQVIYPGADMCGAIDVIDIGIPPSVSKEIDAQQNLTSAPKVQSILGQRPPEMHKGNAGHVLVVAGSTGKTGAAAMTSTSALRVGGGLVTLAVAQSLNPIMEGCLVEAMTAPLPDGEMGYLGADAFDAIAGLAQDKACLALGPGLGTAPETIALSRHIIKEINIPLVIDADGLRYLITDAAVLLERTAPVVLTPHPGEMAKLLNVSTDHIQNNRLAVARQFATQYRTTVVLKGARTIIADPKGAVWINPTGNAGMAAGGMGDVLTGMIAGLIGQGCSPLAAAQAGTYLHGYTADLLKQDRPWGYLATEVMNHLPFAIGHILKNPPPLPLNRPIL